MPRVLFLAYHFPPIGGCGVQRSVKFVRYLPEHGFEPIVLTGSGKTDDRWTPPDETLVAEVSSEIEAHRVPGPEPSANRGWRRRAERLLELPTPLARWWTEGAVALGRDVGRDADLIHAVLGPYETAEAAARLSRELGRPWIADLQDPWALDEMWMYPSALHRHRDLRRMRSLLGTAGAIVMNTPEAERRLRSRFPELDGTRVAVIPNGFDAADFEGPAPSREDGKFRIVHTGTLHTEAGRRHRKTRVRRRLLGGAPVPTVDIYTRSHAFLLQAVADLLAEEPALRSTLDVCFAGVLTSEDRRLAAGSPVVRFTGYLPHGETIALVRSADLLFLPMHDLPAGTRAGIVPGKTYEYLAAGRPILAAVPDGDARDLLTDSGTGRLCRPSDAGAMAAIIWSELERWRSGVSSPAPVPEVAARYERRHLTDELAVLYARVLGLRDRPVRADPPRKRRAGRLKPISPETPSTSPILSRAPGEFP